MENITWAKNLAEISVATYLVVFGGGLLTSLTPCVYPLVPIIVGVIGASKEKSIGRNFILSLSYVVGMAITFSILGVIAALTGQVFGRIQSSALAHLIVGGAIIITALSLIDVIPMPSFFIKPGRRGQGLQRRKYLLFFFNWGLSQDS